MRRVLSILAVLGMAAGCGGGGTEPVNPNPPPPPPPPGPPGAPASLVVQAGDGQVAEPGAAVAVKPVVLVRDAGGRAVPGVAVSFAVDSGGGTLVAASATSSASGTASPGDWTLGTSEGRNVLSVQAGSLTARVVASARYATAEVANQTISGSGGAIALGSGPLSGFALTVPSGAFTGGVNVRITYGSAAGVPHDSIARIASPLITIESDAPGLAEALLTIRIPAKIEPGEYPMVTYVDPTTGFLSALPTIDFDANSVTAEAPALTDQPLLPLNVQPGVSRANVGLPPGPAPTKAWMVVQAVKFNINLLPTVTGFNPGVDDWEFPTQTTAIGKTALGQVASERYYYLNRKSGGGPLWERFQKAKGVLTSNSAGLYWTAGLHAALLPTLQKHFTASVAQRAANPAKYDNFALQHIVMSMLMSKGKPQVVVMLDPATYRMYPALVYGYSGPLGQQLLVADPDKPGDLTVRLSIVNGSPKCVSNPLPCVMTVGLNYISNWLDPHWPQVIQETMYKAWFPPASVGRNLGGSNAGGPAAPGAIDTLFFGRDTGSVYTLIPSWPYQLPTGLPNPTSVLRTQAWFENAPGGSWSASTSGASNNLEFLDAANLRISASNAGVDRLFGIEPRVVWPPPASVSEGWNGFKLYRLIKFVPKLTGAYGPPGQQTDFTISTAGGPPLPDDYIRHVEFGDGSTSTWQNSSNTTATIYADNQNRIARLAIIHPVTRDTVARASVILASLLVTPNPLNGNSDTDYTFTATYPRALPPNATWDWDLDDGRTRLDVSNKETIRYPNNFRKGVDTFDIKVTLRSAGQVVAKDSARAIIQMVSPAWKFTSVSVQFRIVDTTGTKAGPNNDIPWGAYADSVICYTCWKSDSAMLARLASNQSDGGLLYIDREYAMPAPFPPFGLIKQGIYLLEGTNITATRLDTHLDVLSYGQDIFGLPPVAGRIRTHWLTWSNYGFRQDPPRDANWAVFHSETGSLTNGAVAGTSWGAGVPGFPSNIRRTIVNFNGNVATGTVTVSFRIGHGVGTNGVVSNVLQNTGLQVWRIDGILSFTAQRIR